MLSTLRHAADSDYELVVVKDACADIDEEVHRVLIEKVFPRQATVVTTAELAAAVNALRARTAPPQLPAVLRRPGHLADRHVAHAVRDGLDDVSS